MRGCGQRRRGFAGFAAIGISIRISLYQTAAFTTSSRSDLMSSRMRLLDERAMKNLISHVDALNVDKKYLAELIPFVLEDKEYGYVSESFLKELHKHPQVFDTASTSELRLVPDVEEKSVEERSNAVAEVAQDLKDKGVISGWRDELLPVSSSYSSDPVLLIERAAYPFFGFKGYGVHINGFVRKTNMNDSNSGNNKHNNNYDNTNINHGQPISHLWVARRSQTKSTWPGMLDHIAAGGQPHGIDIINNVIKECQEEANIPINLAENAKPVGAVTYVGLDEDGNLKRDCLFCFDLELPDSFTPTPVDGEVEAFELQNIDWVIDKVVAGGDQGYKPNCNLVLIDFFVRQGLLHPESPHYLELVGKLRAPGCS